MNNKPRYTEGTIRYQIVDLLHVCSVITPRTYAMFDNPQQIANAMVKLRKERVIEKSHNKEIFENFVLSNYKGNLEEYFIDNLPSEDIDYFENYGTRDTKRAKYCKDKEIINSQRVIRNSEITILMYASGIPTLPVDKKSVVKDKTLTDNVYYQSREIKYYSGYSNSSDESNGEYSNIATRMNGTLLTAGGNYNIYHLGRDIQTWSAQGEYKLKNYIQNMLSNYINKTDCVLDKAILFTYDLNIFLRLLNPSKSIRSRYDALNMTYDKLYLLPYSNQGKEMIRIMTESDWEYKLKWMLLEEEPQDTSRLDVTCDYYDGETYIFIFCIPDISRYLDFYRKAALVNDRNRFAVYCFDYQQEFIMKSIEKYANISVASFDDIVNEWKEKYSNQIRTNQI